MFKRPIQVVEDTCRSRVFRLSAIKVNDKPILTAICLAVGRATRVPLFVSGPNVPKGVEANHLIGHIDLAPTFVALGGGKTPSFLDGHNFSSLLTTQGLKQFPSFRQALLIENWYTLNNFGTESHTASKALRMVDSIYTEWANGDKDFFDLKKDPDQLINTYDTLHPTYQVFLENWLRLLKNPRHGSVARFSNPRRNGQVIAKGNSLRGLAEDPIGVKRVRLSIQDARTKRYWNGNAWQNGFKQVDAQLENPDGQITFWNYRSLPKDNNSPGGDVIVWAWAFDKEFHRAQPNFVTFKYDQKRPEIAVNFPKPSQKFSGPVFFQGTAKDDLRKVEIRLFVRDRSTNKYWDGKDFHPNKEPIILNPDSKGEWGLMSSMPIGNYEVTAIAIDSSRNSSLVSTSRFEVN